jgi:hypothetical protein
MYNNKTAKACVENEVIQEILAFSRSARILSGIVLCPQNFLKRIDLLTN